MSSTATSSPNAANVLEPIAEDMQQVNRVIRQRLASEVMLINQISEYIIGAGGKRLRPALLLLVAGALGDTTGHRHELAAVVEFIHTATLLHDDVVDESDLRRGRKTANALFGNAASVLVCAVSDEEDFRTGWFMRLVPSLARFAGARLPSRRLR